eukprot:8041824-Pyramimonas_sp.AAC.1
MTSDGRQGGVARLRAQPKSTEPWVSPLAPIGDIRISIEKNTVRRRRRRRVEGRRRREEEERGKEEEGGGGEGGGRAEAGGARRQQKRRRTGWRPSLDKNVLSAAAAAASCRAWLVLASSSLF